MKQTLNHTAPDTEASGFVYTAWRHRTLIQQLVHRDIVSRYKGSVLGILWSAANPLLTMLGFLFVFGFVFRARVEQRGLEGNLGYVLFLFFGLAVFWMAADVIGRAPGLVIANPSYVKRVVFPLEILPIVSLASALFQFAINLSLVAVLYMLLIGPISWTVVYLPLILLPLTLFLLGVTWIFASLGVFFRDLGQMIGPLNNILLMMSPTIYPLSQVPEPYRTFLYLNPLTFVIESGRQAMFSGQSPDLLICFYMFVMSWVIAVIGFVWFSKTKRTFADVI